MLDPPGSIQLLGKARGFCFDQYRTTCFTGQVIMLAAWTLPHLRYGSSVAALNRSLAPGACDLPAWGKAHRAAIEL
jgi:hypothetical protein